MQGSIHFSFLYVNSRLLIPATTYKVYFWGIRTFFGDLHAQMKEFLKYFLSTVEKAVAPTTAPEGPH